MTEGKRKELSLIGEDDEIVNLALWFAYTGRTQDIYSLASKMEDGLGDHCVRSPTLIHERLTAIYLFADKYGFSDLVDHTISLIRNSLEFCSESCVTWPLDDIPSGSKLWKFLIAFDANTVTAGRWRFVELQGRLMTPE